ncbi:preprotein translocase subunit YajC [Nocardioides daedukensis]|uniref:Preprotein translocase subunit YajC n=1 Tax=Nocardioides daedukensis TaxID=634462 RepID=A0A7Y9UR99_9ACTN|nr:hypothetical protein [Nocardioides daedukensis]NYG59456.1 preprotein translocase subunit YajC [Nocardioides daedukensis]
MSATSGPSRLWPFVVAIVMLFFINLPLAHLKWTEHRLDRDGVAGVGEVTATKAFGGKHFVTFRLPASIDPDQKSYTVEVPGDSFDEAKAAEQLPVDYLPEDPSTNRAVDEVPPGSVAVWLTALADLTVLAMLALMFWSRRHGMLVIEATEDLTRCKPDDTVVELGGGMVLVRGDITEIHDDHVVVQANSDTVKVILGDHHNPVGHQQPVQVRGVKVKRR